MPKSSFMLSTIALLISISSALGIWAFAHQPLGLLIGLAGVLGGAVLQFALTLRQATPANPLKTSKQGLLMTLANTNLPERDIEYIKQTEWVLDALAGGVMTVDQQGRILYLNSGAERVTGYTHAEAQGKLWSKIFNIEGEASLLASKLTELNNSADPELHLQFDQIKLISKSGTSGYLELHISRIMAQNPAIVFIFRDLTSERKVMSRLYRQAAHDPLTGLMNRRGFEQYVAQLSHSNPKLNPNHVLVSIDLDNFKIVNDTSGHQAGDELLRQVAQIFLRAVRRTDKVARMGGDEFAILLEDCVLDKGIHIMESIQHELRGLRFSWQGHVFNTAASIGVLEFKPTTGYDVTRLFAEVDKACYTAKALGRNQISVYTAKANALTQTETTESARTDWGKLLQEAVQYNYFVLFVQPILPLQEHMQLPLVHYEVLLRLPYLKNLLSPGSFLPAADRLDMMARIDRWIIKRVLEEIAHDKFNTPSHIEPRFMINLSSQAVQDVGLYEYIVEQIKAFNTNPKLLCFEISESVAIANFVHTKRLMKALDQLGVSLVLDDFGSGFSSLSYIRDLPLSYLKIDGNFVHNLLSSPVDAAMIKAVHEVGQVMNLYTIAELVEDGETLEQLRAIGINFAQGFYCGKPFPLSELSKTGLRPAEIAKRLN